MGKIIDDKTFHFSEPMGINQKSGKEEVADFDLVFPERKDGMKLIGFIGCNPQYN